MTQKKFTSAWKGSAQPRKQRKYRYTAPLHVRQKLVHVHLSPELQKKYNIKSLQVRVGDNVRILRGSFKKKEAKVERVLLLKECVFVAGMEYIRKDGTKVPVQFHPSSLMITELLLDDKKRKEKLDTGKTNIKKKIFISLEKQSSPQLALKQTKKVVK